VNSVETTLWRLRVYHDGGLSRLPVGNASWPQSVVPQLLTNRGQMASRLLWSELKNDDQEFALVTQVSEGDLNSGLGCLDGCRRVAISPAQSPFSVSRRGVSSCPILADFGEFADKC
jgi:hypothetical protein